MDEDRQGDSGAAYSSYDETIQRSVAASRFRNYSSLQYVSQGCGYREMDRGRRYQQGFA